jgi:hypothetical protein
LASLRHRPRPGEGAFDDPALGQDEAWGVTQSLDDLEDDARENAFQRAVEFRPLVASVGVELGQERGGAKPARHQQRPAVAVLDGGGMHDRVHQQALRIDKHVPAVGLASRAAASRHFTERAPSIRSSAPSRL